MDAKHILDALRRQGIRVNGLSTDSRALAPGEVFLAYPGKSQDGRRHIVQAVANGAAGVLWERADFEWDHAIDVPNLHVQGLRDLAGPLAHEVYGRPTDKLWMMGVTGTNGKTSSSQWLARACTACGARTAVIGTLGIGFADAMEAGINTTPDPVLLQRSLASLLAQGAQGVAMEVSSIGLDQGRVNGIAFGAALFTNLSRDHLDYHGDMENYALAKQKLFLTPGLRHAVLNLDDVQGVRIAQMLGGSGINRAGYSQHADVAARSGLESWVEAHDIQLSPRGMAFTVKSSWGEGQVQSALLGSFNVSNLLGVLGTMLASGVPFYRALASLAALEAPPGRMQREGGHGQPLVVVDYAHTPDALEQTLMVLKDVAERGGGRLICLFGCGGDRDHGKRPMMGAVAARHADRIVITSDNPRREDARAIIDEILQGIEAATAQITRVEPDRAQAIALAIGEAGANDVVLLAGKGHEDYQQIGDTKLPFSDAAVAREVLDKWSGA